MNSTQEQATTIAPKAKRPSWRAGIQTLMTLLIGLLVLVIMVGLPLAAIALP